jgi:hypothetical protein
MEAFFARQFQQAGAEAELTFRTALPQRAAGFGFVSLPERVEGRKVAHLLLDRPALLADLKATPIVNLHAPRCGRMHADLRLLLERGSEGLASDGLWVFTRDWMAPWFDVPLEFPELGLTGTFVRPAPAAVPARTWDRRSALPAPLPA